MCRFLLTYDRSFVAKNTDSCLSSVSSDKCECLQGDMIGVAYDQSCMPTSLRYAIFSPPPECRKVMAALVC